MSHKTLIGGTAYEVTGGRTLVGGTGYDIALGKTLVGGTGYEVPFTEKGTFTVIVMDSYGESDAVPYTFTYEVGQTWVDFVNSKYNTDGIFSITTAGHVIMWGVTGWVLEMHIGSWGITVKSTDTINYYADEYDEYDADDIQYEIYNPDILGL